MLAKILAGVLAAVAVTGVGVYFALPDNEKGCCGTRVTEPTTLPVSEGKSCCAAHDATASCIVDEPKTCCAAKTAETSTNPLAACVGGMPTAAQVKACTKCCDE